MNSLFIRSTHDIVRFTNQCIYVSACCICDRVKKYQRKKNQRIDYNAEIPFEKQPVPGFFDTSEETVESE